MTGLALILGVGLAGAGGAMLRSLLGRLDRHGGLGTLLANGLACLLAGVLVATGQGGAGLGPVLLIGFCGALSTVAGVVELGRRHWTRGQSARIPMLVALQLVVAGLCFKAGLVLAGNPA